MPFVEECEVLFGSKDLYTALGLTKDASEKNIKHSYRKMSLKVHPDKVSNDEREEATRKFQILCKIYKILSDKESRKIYDETGCVDDEMNYDIFNWKQFWSSRFGDLDEAIKKYTDEYWGSKDEKRDLKEKYSKYKGDMNKIMDNMYCRVLEHEPRYRKLIEGWIKNDKVPAYDAFTKETNKKRSVRKRKYQKEEKLVEENKKTFEKELGTSMSDIAGIIAQKNEERLKKQDAFLDNLAAKYAKPKSSKNKAGTSKKKA